MLSISLGQRIFGGTEAVIGEFPWQVSLQYSNPCGVPFCSGIILDKFHILTAASCSEYATRIAFWAVFFIGDVKNKNQSTLLCYMCMSYMVGCVEKNIKIINYNTQHI